MKTRDQIIEASKKALERELRDHDRKAAILEQLPNGLPFEGTGVFVHTSGPAWVSLKVADRRAALAMMGTLTPAKLARVKCSTFAAQYFPAEDPIVQDPKWVEVIDQGLHPFWFVHSPGKGYPSRTFIRWFHEIAPGKFVRISCELSRDPARLRAAHQYAGKTTESRVVRYHWEIDWVTFPHGSEERISGGPDHPPTVRFYFFEDNDSAEGHLKIGGES